MLKTHGGVQSEFARLVKDDMRFDLDQRRFLGRAYNLKGAADYETGPAARVSGTRAPEAIDTAKRFVASICSMIAV